MSKKDKHVTTVHFRKCEDICEDGKKSVEIAAIFATSYAVDNLLPESKVIDCYLHVGQHGECDVGWAKGLPMATEEECKDLFDELTEQVGYNLKVA